MIGPDRVRGAGPALAAFVIALSAGAAQPQVRPPRDVVRAALQDELARTMRSLRLDTLPGPYFVAYRVDDIVRTVVKASRGGLLENDSTRSRLLTVEVRVGDYAFDNSNFLGMPTGGAGMFRRSESLGELPLDDDYREIRRQVWLATDRAYKSAVEQLARKRATVQSLTQRDSVPDFSRESVVVISDSTAVDLPRRAEAESLVRALSAAFRDMPQILASEVAFDTWVARTDYVNSEGTSFVRVFPRLRLHVEASGRAADGAPLGDVLETSGTSRADFPGRDSLGALVRQLGDRVTRLREAPTADSYDGPILFTEDAAGALFQSLLAPRLLASRQPVVDNPMFLAMLQAHAGSRVDDIGTRVLPRFLSATADPTLRTWQGRSLGGFRVDDEGVLAHPTPLVDHGVLRSLLTTRTPVRGIDKSSGSCWGGGPVIGTLVVRNDSGLTDDALKRRLIALATARGAPYGVIVTRLSAGPVDNGDPLAMLATLSGDEGGAPVYTAAAAVRLYADGHEEPMRGAEIVGLTAASLKGIVAASQSQWLYSEPGGIGGGMAGMFWPGMMTLALYSRYESSYVVPGILLDDVSIRRPRGEASKPPVLTPPWVGEP
jgi:hypothetical protein